MAHVCPVSELIQIDSGTVGKSDSVALPDSESCEPIERNVSGNAGGALDSRMRAIGSKGQVSSVFMLRHA